MRELYLNVSQHFLAGKLAEGLRRHSQKLRAVVAVMAMMVMSCGLWAQIQVGDTLWYETWTGGTADELPSNYSFTGTTMEINCISISLAIIIYIKKTIFCVVSNKLLTMLFTVWHLNKNINQHELTIPT